MKTLIKYTTATALLLSAFLTQAQQNSLFNTYSMDPLQLNIAYAGATCTEANLHYRAQWLGLKETPKVFQVNAHTALGQSNALGLKINSQTMGLLNTLGATIGYAYRFRVTDNAKVHLGIGVGWSQAALNAQRATVIDANDITLNTNSKQTANGFDSEFGAMFIGKTLKAGVSALHLYNSNPDFTGNHGYKSLPQVNTMVSYTLLKDEKVEVEPWLLNRYTVTGANVIEGMVNVRFLKAFSVGAGYRSGYGVLALLGAKIGNIKLAYSFDYGAGKNAVNLGTSHQIMLGFSMCKEVKAKPKEDEPVVTEQPAATPVVPEQPAEAPTPSQPKQEEVKQTPPPPAPKEEVVVKEDPKPEPVKEEPVKNTKPEETLDMVPLQKINEIAEALVFTVNSYSVSAANDKRIREVVKTINNRVGNIVVVGYASKEGSKSHNMELAIRRAMVVRQTLINYGVDASRLTIKNGGATDDVHNNTEGNRTVRFETIN